ncbi:calcium-binding protein P-like [Haliotis rufescens]|uniref:calcium-binding protein P-like n=1 Tax=Haliotis rufescens TaxID=6454 RepID=UPI001EB06CE3|nr:calcium-binding protein P-like [Haliotis rufescens]
MADMGFGSIYLGMFLSVGILCQVSVGAVVQEVHVVPSQGQTPGGQQPHYAPPSGQYPQAQHPYPGGYPPEAHPPYATPGLGEQYPGAAAQGSYPAVAYPQQGAEPQAAGFNANTAGQLTPGQSPGDVAYTDPFAAPAQTAYPQGGQPYPASDPSAQAAYHGAPSAGYPQAQQPGPQYQYPSQQYPGPVAQYSQGQYPPQGSPFQTPPAYMAPSGYPGQQGYPDQGYPQTPAAATAAAAAAAYAQAQNQSDQAWPGASFQGPASPQGVPAAPAQPAPAEVQGQGTTSTFLNPAGVADAGVAATAVADTPAQGANGSPTLKTSSVATQKAEYPSGNAIPNPTGGFVAQGTNPAQYKYPDRKPLMGAPGFPTAVADAQVKAGAGTPAFPPAAQQTIPVAQYPPAQYHSLPYPGKGPTSVPHGYPPRGYPYPGPYHPHPPYGMSPYHGGMGHAPYPHGQHARPYQGGPHPPPHAGQAPPQGARGGPNGHPPNHVGQPVRPVPVTTTPIPYTTPGATPFPPELRCYMQSECELGCCYAEDGSILWDHHNNYGKHGYCYQKTATIPGEGCHPALCPCQADQKCTSVPSENATLPTGAGEAAEGAYFGNPKCYNHEQQLQIRDWLKKLETIVRACRLDYLCPLRQAH